MFTAYDSYPLAELEAAERLRHILRARTDVQEHERLGVPPQGVRQDVCEFAIVVRNMRLAGDVMSRHRPEESG
jgi:hypothetical protein